MNDQYRRFTVYLEEEKTRYLKSYLMIQGTNFSVWIRKMVDEELKRMIEDNEKKQEALQGGER